ncbi:MAG: hypothetical protein QW074_07805 [Candidatus Caldarchaeum sp.]
MLPEAFTEAETLLAVMWFLIGLGTGLALLRFWKLILASFIIALLAPVVLPMLGVSLPFSITPENIVDLMINGIQMMASFLSRNQFGALGFLAGAVLGLLTTILRRY